MKTYFKFIVFLLFIFSAKAQQDIIIPIEDYYGDNSKINNAYFKDVNGLLDKYVGTWEYNQNGHYFRIQFYKRIANQTPTGLSVKMKFKWDRIYGFFQYKLNGMEIYNTRLMSDPFVYSDSGSFFMEEFNLHYEEPSTSPCGRSIAGKVTLEYSNENGIEKLNWSREDRRFGPFCETGQTEDETPFQVPADMILIKSLEHDPPPLFQIGN